MIERNLSQVARTAAGQYPVVTITGPRQSGKTTLCQMTFPHLPYISLEPLDHREWARSDPRGFLAEHRQGAVLDEVQHVPTLLSYLQAEVDLHPAPGRFILTGSQHFGLTQAVTQSLAGRTAVLYLLPPSLDELARFSRQPTDLFTTLWSGAYPRIHDRGIPPARWLADYVTTYVQRDVRQLLDVGNLEAFTTFLRLNAGRTAQEQNLSALGADAGITHNTARAWLSVLEAGFLCFRTPPWHANLTKRLVKSPKVHFIDSGLVCHLLGITSPEQLRLHPLRGAIFESWVVAEVRKARLHAGLEPSLYHLRQTRGIEIDLILERGRELSLVEAKSGATVAGDFFTSLQGVCAQLSGGGEVRSLEAFVVYGGDTEQVRQGIRVLPWSAIQRVGWG